MAKPLHVQSSLSRIALLVAMLCFFACDSRTVTLTTWQPSEIDTGGMHSLALVALQGQKSLDAVQLLHHTMLPLEAFDVIEGGRHSNPIEALEWARAQQTDGLIVIQADALSEGMDKGMLRIVGMLTLVDVASGRTLLLEPIDHAYKDDNDPSDNSCEQGLCALQDFCHTLAHRLVPHVANHTLTLFSSAAIAQSEQAITKIIEGDWAAATRIYRDALSHIKPWRTPKQLQARVHYNLGVTLAYSGHLPEGLEHLQKAHDLAPDAFFASELQRAKRHDVGGQAVAPLHRLWRCVRLENQTPQCAAMDPL